MTSMLEGLELEGLVIRMELLPALLLRAEEEAIAQLVPCDQAWLAEVRQQWLANRDLEQELSQRRWQAADLDLHLWRPEALLRFARQRYGPGLEERFLADKQARDQVVYSLLRVTDAGLARELWIRIEEGETSFTEAIAQFSQGPEALHKGVIGPVAIGALQPPQLGEWLRQLRPGDVRPPQMLGEWHVMLRLEQLTPARFDDAMRQALLQESLHTFLQARVQQRLAGDTPELLHFEPSEQVSP